MTLPRPGCEPGLAAVSGLAFGATRQNTGHDPRPPTPSKVTPSGKVWNTIGVWGHQERGSFGPGQNHVGWIEPTGENVWLRACVHVCVRVCV